MPRNPQETHTPSIIKPYSTEQRLPSKRQVNRLVQATTGPVTSELDLRESADRIFGPQPLFIEECLPIAIRNRTTQERFKKSLTACAQQVIPIKGDVWLIEEAEQDIRSILQPGDIRPDGRLKKGQVISRTRRRFYPVETPPTDREVLSNMTRNSQ